MEPVDVLGKQAAEELTDGLGQGRAMLATTEFETDELVVTEAAEGSLELVARADESLPAIDPKYEIGGDQGAGVQAEKLRGGQARISRSMHDEALWAF